MEFGLLGPLLAADEAGPRAVPAARQRTLLAALLTRPNRVVTVDELVEILWDGSPPPGAAKSVRIYASRLRGVLGPPLANRIQTRGPGYLCRVEEDELDTLRFERLCREGVASAKSGAWRQAAALLSEALDMWRGAALEDVASRALHDTHVPPLGQRRVQATEWRVEAELQLGWHDRLVPELRALSAEHPRHERFHAQLMLALYRCAQPAEALAAFQRARRVLVDELGIEPGAELRRLHERILTADGALLLSRPPEPDGAPVTAVTAVAAAAAAANDDWPHPRVARSTVDHHHRGDRTPRMLPPAVRCFTGRQAELDVITSLSERAQASDGASGAPVICAIDGMAGVGKTALAVHAAQRLAARFPDGNLFIDLHGRTRDYLPRTPAEALETLLRALDVPAALIPADLDGRVALYRRRLADSRTLILLDNAADEAQIRPLLPGTAGCLVLVTGRRRLKGLDDAYTLSLDVPARTDAVALLRAVAGRGGELEADHPALDDVADLCGRLPLAVRIAAALLRHRPAWEPRHLADRLRDQAGRIGALCDGERDLGAVLDLSTQALAAGQQQLFRRLGLLPGPDCDAYAAAALAGAEPGRTGNMLEELLDHNLLLQYTPGRYQLHDLIRLHARLLVQDEPAADRAAALDRLLDYYQHTALRADARIARHTRSTVVRHAAPAHGPAFADPDSARRWLRAERPNLLACLDLARQQGSGARVVALSAGLATLLRGDGPWHEARNLLADVLATARRLGDRSAEAAVMTDAGALRVLSGDAAGALADQEGALRLYRELSDRPGRATALMRRGEARLLTGDTPGALADQEESLRLYRELGDRPGQAAAANQLGHSRRSAGDFAGALADQETARQLYLELDDRLGEAAALSELGYVRQLTGDYAGALRDQTAALAGYRSAGYRYGQALSLAWLGEVRLTVGDHATAIYDLEEALELFREWGNAYNRATTLTRLGDARRQTGDYQGAMRDSREALRLHRETGSRGNEAWALNYHAALLADTGDLDGALSAYREALRLSSGAGQADDEALAHEGIGRSLLRRADAATAVAHLNQALDIFKRLGMQADAARVHAQLDAARSG